ncbi:MAG TPA: DUF5677 domain-containing protein [Candidatus Angelobacter sp.]|nr:DUF5677 domain-containing protein [Candidatus Angelobacter sp.]
MKAPAFAKELAKHTESFEENFMILAELAFKVMADKRDDQHVAAIRSRVEICWEIYTSVLILTAEHLGVSSFGQCRNLFENIVSTVYLAKHPELLQDFFDHGKLIAYESLRDMGLDQKKLDVVKAEYDAIKPRFMQGNRALSWHKTTVKELVETSGLAGMYPTFYKKASSVAHGDGFIGTGFKDGKWLYNVADLPAGLYGDLALEFSYPIMVLLFEEIVPAVKFDADKELQAALEVWKNIYKKFIEDKNNEAGQAVQSGGPTT